MGDRQMQAHSPAELQTAKQAIFRTGIPAREYLDRMGDIEARAEAEIMAYVKVMRATPAIALLRIAAKMSSGVDSELIDAIRAVLDLSDPDDVPVVMDDAHKVLDAYEATYHGT